MTSPDPLYKVLRSMARWALVAKLAEWTAIKIWVDGYRIGRSDGIDSMAKTIRGE